MDTFWTFVTALATATLIFVLSSVVGVKLERRRDEAGVERPKRARRISPVRTAVGLAVLVYAAALGAGLLILGGAWIALGAAVALAGLGGGIAIFKTGRELPPPPTAPDGPKHAGPAYFWHCRLPARMLGLGRTLAIAFVAPAGAVALLIAEQWEPGHLRRARRVQLDHAAQGQARERPATRAVPAR
jgi:hypothetical protein